MERLFYKVYRWAQSAAGAASSDGQLQQEGDEGRLGGHVVGGNGSDMLFADVAMIS